MIYKLLKDYLGMEKKEADDYFSIEETGEKWILTARGWLETSTYAGMRKLVEDYAGTYEKGSKNIPAVFTIPKQPKEVPVEGSTPKVEEEKPIEPVEEGDYSLVKSLKGKFGQLVPCLASADGEVFDGLHRKKINPVAWTVKLDQVKTATDKVLARLIANFNRRKYMEDELKSDLGFLKGAGFTVQQIHETTGINERTIYRYIPSELKPSGEKISEGLKKEYEVARQEVTTVTPPIKTQDTIEKKMTEDWRSQLLECSNCYQGFHKDKAVTVDGKVYCPKCVPQIKSTPQKLESRKFEDELKKTRPEVVQKWEDRAATMHPQKSHFELSVIQELQAEGLPLETDREFCVEKTIPDFILKLKDRTIVGYIDCELTHKNRRERDEVLREKLVKLYGFEILVIHYGADTNEEKVRAKQEIREALKW